jgi:hypothetical protein
MINVDVESKEHKALKGDPFSPLAFQNRTSYPKINVKDK